MLDVLPGPPIPRRRQPLPKSRGEAGTRCQYVLGTEPARGPELMLRIATGQAELANFARLASGPSKGQPEAGVSWPPTTTGPRIIIVLEPASPTSDQRELGLSIDLRHDAIRVIAGTRQDAAGRDRLRRSPRDLRQLPRKPSRLPAHPGGQTLRCRQRRPARRSTRAFHSRINRENVCSLERLNSPPTPLG